MFDVQVLLLIALKTGLLMSAAGIASITLARKSAAVRHMLWTAALALSLVMPIAIATIPSLAVVPNPWRSSAPLATNASSIAADGLDQAGWPATIWILWAAGALGFLLRDVVAHAVLKRWIRSAQPLRSECWIAALNCLPMEQQQGIRVLESPHVAGPCTWGLVRPMLLLPATGDAWSEAQRRSAILHEVAHIDRRDYLTTLLSRFACAMHWYNPLVWFAAAQARKLQEQACDDAVLRSGGRASDYAQFLLDMAMRSDRVPGQFRIAMGMAHRSPLHGRMSAILDPNRPRVASGRPAILAGVSCLSCLTLMLAAAATVPPSLAQSDVAATNLSTNARVGAPLAVATPPRTSVRATTLSYQEPTRRRRPNNGTSPESPLPTVQALPVVQARPVVSVVPAEPALSVVPVAPVVTTVPVVPSVPSVPSVPQTRALRPLHSREAHRSNNDAMSGA